MLLKSSELSKPSVLKLPAKYLFVKQLFRTPIKSWVQSLLIASSEDAKRGHRLHGDVEVDSSELLQKLTAAYTDNFIWQAYGDGNLVKNFQRFLIVSKQLSCITEAFND
jgi:hypothetical protein